MPQMICNATTAKSWRGVRPPRVKAPMSFPEVAAMDAHTSPHTPSPADSAGVTKEDASKFSDSVPRRLSPKVIEREREFIADRRAAAGESADLGDSGLAFSGGGIRSASFNLGVVQALVAGNAFSKIDYLSTVSGGGYLGGFLGSQFARRVEIAKPSEPGDKPSTPGVSETGDASATPKASNKSAAYDPDYSTIVPNPRTGRQPKAVRRLLRGGRYLKRFVPFLNRYLFGLVVLNFWIFCGIAALGAWTALAFRCIDWRPVIHFTHAIGLPGDVLRSFFPAWVACLTWFALWIVRYVKQWSADPSLTDDGAMRIDTPKLDSWTRFAALAVVILSALGVVALLAVRDVGFPVWSEVNGIAPALSDTIATTAGWLVVIQLLAIIPAFRLDKLVMSGARPQSRIDSILFNIFGPALVYGLPLLSFGWFACEDVSGVVAHGRLADFEMAGDVNNVDDRNPRLISKLHIRDWAEFWQAIEQRSASAGPYTVDRMLLAAANKASRLSWMDEQDFTALDASIRIDLEYQELMSRTPMLVGFLRFPTIWRLRRERDLSQDAVIHQVNIECLCNPKFYESFPADDVNPNDPDTFVVNPQDLSRARSRAEGLFKLGEAVDSGSSAHRRWLSQVHDANRRAFQAYYGPQRIAKPTTIFSGITWGADQRYRLLWASVFSSIWLAMGFLVNPNFLSLQEFYRERLQAMWLPPSKQNEPYKLSDLDNNAAAPHQFPYLIINATAHIPRESAKQLIGRAAVDQEPRQARFEFAPAYCGYAAASTKQDDFNRYFRETAAFERQLFLDLPGIMAISGSAVSPAMTDNFVLKTLMFVSNMRLGQWVEQPDTIGSKPLYPRLLTCLWQALICDNCHPPFLFLSDGGHYDNLGLEALFDRRLKTIICIDAGYDPEGRFIDLLKAVRRSRFIDGVQIQTPEAGELSFEQCAGLKGSVAKAHFFRADISYPDDDARGTLYYVKPTFSMDESAELINYRDENPDFPHDPTLDQFYDERRFESYRALGWHIGQKLLREYPELAGRSASPAPPIAGGLLDELLEEQLLPKSSSNISALAEQLESDGAEKSATLYALDEILVDRNADELSPEEIDAVKRALMNYLRRARGEEEFLDELKLCISSFALRYPLDSRDLVETAKTHPVIGPFAKRLGTRMRARSG
jgi:hypothetical protein